ncbi:beta-hexosaminidase 3-like [Mangifera indica]|uniref:beta-hexosaminidase 3-like n=1 Tax=Mangifera indica TaxID=29780 RepID=UPI001CF99FBD|nr:beta-hexosaminidase 3-like [Mangifera indica]
MGRFSLWVLVFALVFVEFLVGIRCGNVEDVKVWPLPYSVSHGHKNMYMSGDFKFSSHGSKYSDASGIFKDGFSRFIELLNVSHVVDGNVSKYDNSSILVGLNVVILTDHDELQYGVDESYRLSVPSPEKPAYAQIEAQTVYGALHALQTLSQICQFNFTSRIIEVPMTPWTISDKPRFPFRGLLIDTSRHYQPVSVIKSVIDSMAYSKLNVLHWHIVDTQSFPLEIPSYPKLWDGAYSDSERYTMTDAAEIVSYARKRGINVLAEIDVPGHASSWGVGYPSLWPSNDCQQPLDISNEFTFKVIDGILSDFRKVFKFKFVHLGGDEVNTSCWKTTSHVSKWLKKQGISESEAYQYFVLKVQKIALAHGYELVNWEETFNNFGEKLNQKTVVHNWLGSSVAENVVKAGLRCIVSNQDKWYLDHLDTQWQQFYLNEPLTHITESSQQKLVIGGEVCMWGETVDTSDIQETIWPRAAAAAERMWTPYDKLANDTTRVTGRLAHFRCLLNQRGIAAAPVAADGRGTPSEPDSCFKQ